MKAYPTNPRVEITASDTHTRVETRGDVVKTAPLWNQSGASGQELSEPRGTLAAGYTALPL